MFSGFIKEKIAVSETHINLVRGGEGPPLLLLHGYPQSHVMWHKVADKLAKQFSLVIPDLRGYGDSGKPPSDENHFNYSKRASARDQVEMMAELGHDRFMIAGHDRGGRVAHRMAIDYGDKVQKLCVLDIVPTYRVFADTEKELATKYWHWFFLIQKSPLPETLIGNNVEFYLRTMFGSWGNNNGFVTEQAFAEYLRCLESPETIHTTCEDYRAGASIDLDHDKADINQKISCPLLALWGEFGAMHTMYNVLETWRERAVDVNGWPVKCGHFIPEEAPDAIVETFSKFFGEKSIVH